MKEYTKMNKKVGILVPFYNQEQFVGEALASYLGQSYETTCIYALDDFSNDQTAKELKIFTERNGVNPKRNITTVYNPVNIGVFRSYNYLAYLAIKDGCDYIIPCGGDDVMMRDCIEKAVQWLEEGDYDCVDLPVVTIGLEPGIVMRPNAAATYETAWQQNPFTSFMLFKSEIWNRYNGYDTSITPPHVNTGIEDVEFHLRLLRDGIKIGFLEEVLYNYRIHASNSHRQAAPHLEELYNIIKAKHGRSNYV